MRKTLAIGFCVLAILTVYGYLKVDLPRKHFEQFISAVREVEVAKTTLDEFRTKMEQKGFSNLALPCKGTTCSFELQVDNTFLHRIRVAPSTVARVSVAFEKGVASEIYILTEVHGSDQNGTVFPERTVVIWQTLGVTSQCPSAYILNIKRRGPSDKISSASIRMDACVSREDKMRALAINANCFSRLGGCKDVEAILPQIFNAIKRATEGRDPGELEKKEGQTDDYRS